MNVRRPASEPNSEWCAARLPTTSAFPGLSRPEGTRTWQDAGRLLGTDPTGSSRKEPALHCNSSRDRMGRDREVKKKEVPRQDNLRWVARCANARQPPTS